MWAIVPVKQFHLAKRRLSPMLSEHERAGLCRAMLADVLDRIRATPGIRRTLVVTREPDAHLLARQGGAEVLDEAPGPEDLVAAVTQGARAADAGGARGIVIVPGDLPLASPDELAAVLAEHGDGDAPAVTLVPDAERAGTNCLVCSPATIIDFHYGTQSCAAHARAATDAGVTPRILQLPGLGLDVDTPADLAAFAARPAGGEGSHTLAYLEASGIAERLRRLEAPAASVSDGDTAP